MNLQVSDFFGESASGVAQWAVKHLVEPSSNEFHYGWLLYRLPDNDWVTLESRFPRGLQVGRLSWHKRERLHFYRLNIPDHMRKNAAWGAVEYGPSWYDTKLVLRFCGCAFCVFLSMLRKFRFRKFRVNDFDYIKDSNPICTEVIVTGCRSVGFDIIPAGTAPIPNAFEIARLEGKFFQVFPRY